MPSKLQRNELDMIRDGVWFPDHFISRLEANLFERMGYILEGEGYEYLSIPSLITRDTYERQGAVPWEKVFKVDDHFALAGSAEQGILELFKGKHVEPKSIYAKNQCFRSESGYEGWKRLREFNKMEMFQFRNSPDQWSWVMEELIGLGAKVLDEGKIQYRVVDVTKRDPGYHVCKKDIEVWTETYGWMETHSITYFGEEQSRRFDITGATHTFSATAIASPRILVPFLER